MMDSAEAAPAAAREGTAKPLSQWVVRRASLTILVEDPASSVEALESLAARFGGYVASSNVRRDPEGIAERGEATLKIAANQLPAALAALRGQGKRVLEEDISTEAVGDQAVDLQARLTALRAAEAQYSALMQRTGSLADIGEVLRQQTEVRSQIESIDGQFRNLSQTVAFSTVSLNYQRPYAVSAVSGFSWLQPIQEAADSLLEALQTLYVLLVNVLVVVVPLLLVLWWPLRWAWRKWKRRQKA
jgi:hypothetical protein